MIDLITLELAKQHLKLTYYAPDGTPLTDNSEDELIALYVSNASQWVQEYIGVEYGESDEIPAPVKNACLLMVGESYARRESGLQGTIYSDTETVEKLLQPYRKRLSVY